MTSMMPNETHTSTTGGTGGTSSSGGQSGGAQEKISRVASEAPAQAGKVAQDVKTQLRETTQRTLGDVRSQADDRASKAAQGLRDLSTRAQALAEGRTEEAGNLGGMVENLGRQASEFAERLEMGGVQGLLDDVSRFGRKRPMAFLALAVGAGFVAGRVLRTGAEVTSSDDGNVDPMRSMTPAPFALRYLTMCRCSVASLTGAVTLTVRLRLAYSAPGRPFHVERHRHRRSQT